MTSTPDPDFWGEERPARVPRPASARPASARPASPRGDHRPTIGDGIGDRLRDLWDTWRADPRFGLAVLVAVAVIAGVIWYQVGTGGGASEQGTAASRATPAAARPGGTPSGDDTRPSAVDAAPGGGTASGDEPLVVHVAGAVQHPGVVELEPGARVIDALEAAGGGLADADLDRLNLAAKLVDGQRVLVQRVGDPSAPDQAAPGATVPGGAPGAAGDPDAGTTNGLVNLNSATSVQLEELPGIGPVLAEAIITERTRRGGFRSVNELRDVRGIGEKRFTDLVDRVTV